MLIVWNILRGVSVTLFFLLIYQTGETVWYYLKARNRERGYNKVLQPEGVLPSHVIDVGIVLIVFAAEAVWQNISRINQGFSFDAVVNPLLLAFANQSVLLIRRFERRRYSNSAKRPRMPYDQGGSQ